MANCAPMARTGTPDLLPILRSQTQAAVLTHLLLGPSEPRTVADVAAAVGADVWSVRRELARLERAGIVTSETVGRILRFMPAEASPLLEPLRALVERSIGVAELITDALRDLAGIDAAVLIGSWARGEVGAVSDVDVMIVGDVDHASLGDALIAVERRVGREIDFTAMTAAEFRERLADGSGFLRDVLARPHEMLIGSLP